MEIEIFYTKCYLHDRLLNLLKPICFQNHTLVNSTAAAVIIATFLSKHSTDIDNLLQSQHVFSLIKNYKRIETLEPQTVPTFNEMLNAENLLSDEIEIGTAIYCSL